MSATNCTITNFKTMVFKTFCKSVDIITRLDNCTHIVDKYEMFFLSFSFFCFFLPFSISYLCFYLHTVNFILKKTIILFQLFIQAFIRQLLFRWSKRFLRAKVGPLEDRQSSSSETISSTDCRYYLHTIFDFKFNPYCTVILIKSLIIKQKG